MDSGGEFAPPMLVQQADQWEQIPLQRCPRSPEVRCRGATPYRTKLTCLGNCQGDLDAAEQPPA
eukprot:6828345-Alexandrium_andersonii.AAC.1